MSLTKSQAAKYRKLSLALAKEIGADIYTEIDADHKHMYYVTGPHWLYVPCENEWWSPSKGSLRKDPFEGDHYCYNWQEVYDNLRRYELDILCHEAGMDDNDREADGGHCDRMEVIRNLCDKHPEYQSLWDGWRKSKELTAFEIMADWIEEYLEWPDIVQWMRSKECGK